MKRYGLFLFMLVFLTGFAFAQEAEPVEEVEVEVDDENLVVESADSSEEPAVEETFKTFEGELPLKSIKVYENRIYRDDLHGVFGNYIAASLIAGDIKKEIDSKTVTHQRVVEVLENLRAKDEVESVDFYYTLDKKGKLIIHVTVIDNPGFQEFEDEVKLSRIDFYCRNNFFVSRQSLGKTVNLDKKGSYTEAELREAIERIEKLYVYNDIDWGLRQEGTHKDGTPHYAFQVILSEYGGDKNIDSDEILVSKIQFLGNWYTQDWVFLQELDFKEGDTVSVEKLDAAAQRLMNLGVCLSVDWGVIEDEEGNTILVFMTRDKLTLLPSFDFAFGSDQLRLGIGFWDENFLGTNTMIVFNFKLKDLMPVFALDLSIPKIANSNFTLGLSVSYDSTNKYTQTEVIKDKNGKETADFTKLKGYREDAVSLSLSTSYALELADKRHVMWYQSFGFGVGYNFVQSKKRDNSQFMGVPEGFAKNWLKYSETFAYDETKIGLGHYVNFDVSYGFNNYRRDGGYRNKGIKFALSQSLGVPAKLEGYMSKKADGSAIDEKVYSSTKVEFYYHWIPVQWFEFKGYLSTGWTTTEIDAKKYYFGDRSLARNVPANMHGQGKGFYRGNFDICFTPPIPYVSKVVIFELGVFADVGNYGDNYGEMWKQTPIWSTGLGLNIYVPFFEGLYLCIDLSWGPNNIQKKDGKPKFNFGVSKYYN